MAASASHKQQHQHTPFGEQHANHGSADMQTCPDDVPMCLDLNCDCAGLNCVHVWLEHPVTMRECAWVSIVCMYGFDLHSLASTTSPPASDTFDANNPPFPLGSRLLTQHHNTIAVSPELSRAQLPEVLCCSWSNVSPQLHQDTTSWLTTNGHICNTAVIAVH
jgi:hypothetical protein